MPKPHGGKLVNRHIKKDQTQATEIPEFEINTNLSEDIINIANGIFSPLEGFLCYNNLENVINKKRLENDTPWTIPILLDFNKENIKEGETILLSNNESGIRALLDIDEIYTYDKKTLAQKIFSTTDIKHPGVANI